jgi:hypothetical protein
MFVVFLRFFAMNQPVFLSPNPHQHARKSTDIVEHDTIVDPNPTCQGERGASEIRIDGCEPDDVHPRHLFPPARVYYTHVP